MISINNEIILSYNIICVKKIDKTQNIDHHQCYTPKRNFGIIDNTYIINSQKYANQ